MQRFPAFRSKAFTVFWLGQLLSLIGTWMQNTVQPYVAYRISGNPFDLGLIGFAQLLPALIFTLPGGVWIEHMNKRHVVIAMQIIMMAQAFMLAALTFTGHLTIPWLVIMALVLGFANAFEIVARQSMMIELVDREALPSAIALGSAAFNVARVLGPSLSAPFLLLLNQSGEGWAFFANGVSYLFVIGGLLWVPYLISKSARNVETAPIHKIKSNNVAQDFLEAQRYVRSQTVLLGIILSAAVSGLFAWPAIGMLPVFARDVLAQPNDIEAMVASRNALLVTAQGVGALAASLLLTWFSTYRHKGRLMMIGQIAFAAVLIVFALSRDLTISLLLIAIAGWGVVTQNNLQNQIVQLVTPREMRGRVLSNYVFALQGVTPFGNLAAGWIASHYGAPLVVLLAGVFCLLWAIGMHLSMPSIRKFDSQTIQPA